MWVPAIRFLAVLALLASVEAWAGDWEDGYAAYMQGDYDTAFRLLKPLAEQDNALAQEMLGVMYQNGQGVQQNYGESQKWYGRAAEQREADATKREMGSNK